MQVQLSGCWAQDQGLWLFLEKKPQKNNFVIALAPAFINGF